jgi:hypothetical protein
MKLLLVIAAILLASCSHSPVCIEQDGSRHACEQDGDVLKEGTDYPSQRPRQGDLR